MNKLITFTLLLFSLSLSAQQNEIKIDAFGFSFKEFNISYEQLVTEKLGVEVGLGYLYSPQFLNTVTINPILLIGPYPSGSGSYKKTAWSFLVAGKYYLSPKPEGNRFYLGGFLLYRTEPEIEQAYFDDYETLLGEPDRFSPGAELIVGGSVGYKFLVLKQRIIIEPIYGLGINIGDTFGSNGVLTTDGYLKLNLGYRF